MSANPSYAFLKSVLFYFSLRLLVMFYSFYLKNHFSNELNYLWSAFHKSQYYFNAMLLFLIRNELTRFLHSLDIYFSRRKWHQIFRQMNKNQDNPRLISLSEFSLFVFPEHSTALSQEKKRLEKIKAEVTRLCGIINLNKFIFPSSNL